MKNRWAYKHAPDELIEDAPGFEGHVVELRKWRLEYEEREREEELEALRTAMAALAIVLTPYIKVAEKDTENRSRYPTAPR